MYLKLMNPTLFGIVLLALGGIPSSNELHGQSTGRTDSFTKAPRRVWQANAADFFPSGDHQRLCNAISVRDEKSIKKLLLDPLDFDFEGRYGVTVLFWACLEGDLVTFEELLKRGATPDIYLKEDFEVKGCGLSFKRGYGVLVHALWCLDRDEFFLKGIHASKDIRYRYPGNMTLLHVAYSIPNRQNRPVILDSLVKLGIDVNSRTEGGRSVCHYAAENYPDDLIPMVRLGCDTSVVSKSGERVVDQLRMRAKQFDALQTRARALPEGKGVPLPKEEPVSNRYQVILNWLESNRSKN